MALKLSLVRAIIGFAMAAAVTADTSATANATAANATAAAATAAADDAGINADYHFLWAPAASNQSTCEPSTFSRNSSSNPAADWRSCTALFSSWTNHNGTFLIHDTYGQVLMPILKSEACVLGVKAADGGNGGFYAVGDRDVKAILKTALLNYSDGTDMSVQGDVNCTVISGGRAALHWEIYRDEQDEE